MMARKTVLLTWGITAAIFTAATVIINWPYHQGESLSGLRALCASQLGAVAKAYGGTQIVARCDHVTLLYDLGNYGRWAAVLAAAAVTIIVAARRPPVRSLTTPSTPASPE